MAVQRWVFTDPSTSETYTVPINPNQMTAPFPQRQFTTKATTAVDGKGIVYEGQVKPADWNFQGVILDSTHYGNLKDWVYNHGRIQITDHYGRIITCVLQNFNATPKRAASKPWKHEYTITAIVFSVTDPTIL